MITLCRDLDFIVRLQNRVKCFVALMGKLLFMENKTKITINRKNSFCIFVNCFLS